MNFLSLLQIPNIKEGGYIIPRSLLLGLTLKIKGNKYSQISLIKVNLNQIEIDKNIINLSEIDLIKVKRNGNK